MIQEKNSMQNLFRFLARIIFAGLIVFEVFNYFSILKFKVDFTWFGLILTAVVIWGGLEIVHHFLKVRCHRILHSAIWFLSIFALYVDALGDIFHCYSRFGWYDQVAHFAGSAVAGAIIFSVLKAVNPCRVNKMGDSLMYFLTFTSVTTLGVFYELEEYLEDYFNFTNRLGDGPDTANDLLLDVVGVLTVILFVIVVKKIKNKTSSTFHQDL
jgi:uncharacterized membrane protein YjdF